MKSTALAYLNLTKPRISLLFAVSGLAALIIEGSIATSSLSFWLITLALFLVGGSANAFNQFFERNIDRKMERTAKKRPLPSGQISPPAAATFSVITGLIGIALLSYWGTWLATCLAILTILFYSFYYTLWLKPRTPYNIVIGGAAGAAAPLIAWAAVNGTIAWPAVVLFLLIFFWTPPHFWALAICCKEDYAKVGYPMLPNVIGDDKTRVQILLYSFSLIPLSLLLLLDEKIGLLYGSSSFLLGGLFIYLAVMLLRKKTTKASWMLFGYSIVYLILLLMILIVDVLV